MSTIDKALELLNYFSAQRPEISLAEFTKLTQFDKGTLHRYLTSLRDNGFLEQNLANKAYRMGPALIRLAAVREKTVPLVEIAAPHIDKAARQTGELVHASVPQNKGLTKFYALDGGSGGTRVGYDESEILPFHATSSGIAMLAFGPPQLIKKISNTQLKRFTQQTEVDSGIITQMVLQAQECGFAIINQTYEADVCSVSVPFFSTSELAMGTIAVATPASRMNDEVRLNHAAALMEASINISRNLGGNIPFKLREKWDAHL